jgi:ABC-2 type transport system ATP-binding protein
MKKVSGEQMFTYQAHKRSYLNAVTVWLVLVGIEGSILIALIALLIHLLWLKLLFLLALVLFLYLLIFRIILSALWTKHCLTATHLILHYGLGRIEVPRDAIKSARPAHERLQGQQPLRGTLDTRRQRITMVFSEDGQILLTLNEACPFRLNRTEGKVRYILFNVDQRDELLAALHVSVSASLSSATSREKTVIEVREDAALSLSAPMQGGQLALWTKNLSRSFHGKVAVEAINLAVRRGEIYGFLGVNGSGKTTTMKMLVGLLEPDGGEAWLLGHNVWTEPVAAKRVYGYVPDHAILYERLTGREFLAFLAQMRGLSQRGVEQRITDLLTLLDLTDVADTVCNTYSFGMKRKLVVAGALLHQPSVLILDEPFNGLDPRNMRRLKTLFAELVGDGTTIFLSTHDLTLAESICHRIGIIHRGRLIAEGSTQELRQLAAASKLEEVFFALTEEEEALP